MHSGLYAYLNKYSLLYSKQFRFRQSFSTTHALMSSIDQISKALDSNLYICGVSLDLKILYYSKNYTTKELEG